jgi:hypothetical protein
MNPRHDDLGRMLEGDDDLSRLIDEMRMAPAPVEAVSERPVGGSIRILRLMAGALSPAELSERSGVQEKLLEEIEEETAELDFGSVKQLAQAFDIRAAHLTLIFELAEAVSAARGPNAHPDR